MKYWTVVVPDENNNEIITVMSEDDIIKFYYPYWSERMNSANKSDLISRENCIEDWITVNWAAPATESDIIRKLLNV